MSRVLNIAIEKGCFADSTAVVMAHNALVHINTELLRLSQVVNKEKTLTHVPGNG